VTQRIVAVVLGLLVSQANAGWRPEYAQLSKEEQQWAQNQHNQRGVNCCSTADGTEAEETVCPGSQYVECGDSQEERYYVRFHAWMVDSAGKIYFDEQVDWTLVPEQAYTQEPHRGPAMVWYYIQDNKAVIRCFARGARAALEEKHHG
jgi:hypothetical protein